MALNPVSTDFIGEIRSALLDAGLLSDQIVILDPKTATTTAYDPLTDTGGESTPTLVIGPRSAYIKAEGTQMVTEKGVTKALTKYRVQFIPEDDDPIFREGWVVRVLAGGANEKLQHYPLAISGEVNGSIVALIKLECLGAGAPTDPYVVS